MNPKGILKSYMPSVLLSLSLSLPASSALAQEAPSPSKPSAPNTNQPTQQKRAQALRSMKPPVDRSAADPQLKKGDIVIEIVDAQGKPVPDARVQLITHFQSISQGDDQDISEKSLDSEGIAHFTNLKSALRFSYSVEVTYQGAHYFIPAFRLNKLGHRVVVHVYPTTKNVVDAQIGVRGFVYVQMQADVLRVEVLYRFINLSRKTWLPENISLSLPQGAQAIETGGNSAKTNFKKSDLSVSLVGTFPPGQKDARYSFQLPNNNESLRFIEVGLPPHVAEIRVLAEKTPELQLQVAPQFITAEPAKAPDGKDVLITRRVMKPGESQLSRIRIQLDGLPVLGPGRWIALGLSLLIALLGVGALFRKNSQRGSIDERDEARQTLLEEMRFLKSAYANKDIGPRTFEQTHREILVALARLEGQIQAT